MMASLFENVDEGSREEGLHEMRTIWKDIYQILGLRQSLGAEALCFAGTLSFNKQRNRVLGEEEASRALITHCGKELKTIVETAEWLRTVVKHVNDLNQDVRRAAVTKISHARFLAISILLRGFESNERKALLDEWEKVTFRIFALCGADTRMKVGQYVRLAFDVYNADLGAADILTKLKQLGEDYDLNGIGKSDTYWSDSYGGWTEELRYLLYRYDEHLAECAGEQINDSQWNKIWTVETSKSVEHIVPQSEDAEFKHHLGNLIMLPPGLNSSLSNRPPKDKSSAYESCGLRDAAVVGKSISETGDWTKADVIERAARIEAFVLAEWGDEPTRQE